MKKVLQKILGQPFIKGFVRFYQSAESDITSIAVAYYLLISIFPLMLIAANIFTLLSYSSHSDSFKLYRKFCQPPYIE